MENDEWRIIAGKVHGMDDERNKNPVDGVTRN